MIYNKHYNGCGYVHIYQGGKNMAKEPKLDAKGYPKFGIRDSLAYAAGDFGCNMSFALKGTMAIFWTQFMQMPSVLYAGLLILVQVWDAINDPLIGSIIDNDKREKYKRGKFLAYVWLGSVGLLVAGSACFIPWFKGATNVIKAIRLFFFKIFHLYYLFNLEYA